MKRSAVGIAGPDSASVNMSMDESSACGSTIKVAWVRHMAQIRSRDCQ